MQVLLKGASSVRYCLLSPATVLPSTAIAPQEKADSPPWITWLIVAIAGGIAALIFSSVLVIYRKRSLSGSLLNVSKNHFLLSGGEAPYLSFFLRQTLFILIYNFLQMAHIDCLSTHLHLCVCLHVRHFLTRAIAIEFNRYIDCLNYDHFKMPQNLLVHFVFRSSTGRKQ